MLPVCRLQLLSRPRVFTVLDSSQVHMPLVVVLLCVVLCLLRNTSERTTRACISGVVERHWMHEVLPACVAASRCIIRAKLVFVMHLLATKLLRDIAESQKELCKGSLAPGNVVHVVPISAAVRAQASAPSLPRTLEWTLQG
eukprot:1144911-Pelagomonas_calceolata.AAC.2